MFFVFGMLKVIKFVFVNLSIWKFFSLLWNRVMFVFRWLLNKFVFMLSLNMLFVLEVNEGLLLGLNKFGLMGVVGRVENVVKLGGFVGNVVEVLRLKFLVL